MSMCWVFSCVVGRGCLLWPVRSLGRTLLAFALLHSVLQGQICLLLQVFLDFLLFHYRGLECKSRKSRNSWSNRQIWPWNTEWSRAKTNSFAEFCQENSLFIANTLFQQHKRRLYTWTSPDGQHQSQIDYILCSQRWRSSIQSAKTRPGADCGPDHELLIAKFRLKLKKVGKTTRPFRYDQNQIPYDYTVEVRNRFKGLDLIDRVPDELWNEVHDIVRRQESRPSPWQRNAKTQNGCLGRPYK